MKVCIAREPERETNLKEVSTIQLFFFKEKEGRYKVCLDVFGGMEREKKCHCTQYSLMILSSFSTSCGKNIKGKDGREGKKERRRREGEIVESGKQRGRGGGVEGRMRPSHAKGRVPTDVSIWKERDW